MTAKSLLNQCLSIAAMSSMLMAFMTPTPVAARTLAQETAPVINEFVFNHTSTDDHEYIEISGAASTDYSAYTLLDIEGDSSGSGVVDQVYTVGSTDAGGYWWTGFLSGELENGTLTLLLVEGWSGSQGDDLDSDDDGSLDSTPWTGIVDSVAVTDGGSSDRTYANVVLDAGFDGGSFTVGGASRIPDGTDTDATADWVRNDFDLAGIPGETGTPELGEALNTPEAENALVTPEPVAPPVINEFVFNHTGTDDHEYVEVSGAASTDYSAYTLLDIEGDSSGSGVVDQVYTVGSTDAGGYWWTGFLSGELENGTLTLLLVEGWSGAQGDDLDSDDDGSLDSTPWTGIVDSVAVTDGGSSDRTYANVVLDAGFDGGSFTVGGASRIPDGTDTDATADWVRNDFDLAGIPGETGTPDLGEALNTPEAENALVTVEPVAPPVINEFVFNHTGTDDHEYVEVSGAASTDYSAYTLLDIEGDSSGSGVVDQVYTVGSTDAGGYWWTGFLSNQLENGTLTLLLVEGWSGAQGADLDTDDDGSLDSTPWTDIVDAVAVTDGGSSDRTYANVVLDAGFDGGSFTVGGASRIPDGTDTDATADWVRNDFDLAGVPGFPGTPDLGEALNTPGQANELVTLTPPVINEFSANTTSYPDVEYVEIFGAPNTDYSAYTVLDVEGDGGGAGLVDGVFSVGTTDGSGFWLASQPDVYLENGTLSLLLVKDFTGDYGDDLDTDNDGTLDATPWSELVDSVAVNDGHSGDQTYGDPTLSAYYDGLAYTPGGASRYPDGADTDTTADWVRNDYDLAGIPPGYPGTIGPGEAYNTPGAPNEIYVAPVTCDDTYTGIHEIQGDGQYAAMTGPVTTQGVVVGDYEGASPNLRGFYIQDPNPDSDPATSEGIFVYNGSNDSVNLGDLVQVSGSAEDYQDQTEIGSVSSIIVCDGNPTVTPADVTLPFPSADYPERFEGMLVRLNQTLYVTEMYQLGRFGQIVMSSGDRLDQPTNVVEPGAPAVTLQAANDLNRIIIDDATNDQDPDPIVFGDGGSPLSASNTLRGGDTATDLIGVMTYGWAGDAASPNAYRVRPINALGGGPPNFVSANPRPSAAPDVGGSVTVVGMNLLNFFNTFDGYPDTVDNCSFGVGGDPADCRGADNLEEFNRQWPKTVAAIIGTDADVIGILEIENDGYGPDSAIQFLVDRLNDEAGAGAYAFIDADAMTEELNALGTDAIKVGILYRPANVTPMGVTAALNTTAFVNAGDSEPRNRPSLAQAFQDNETGGLFVVDINHLKSKGSPCDSPDAGDGQGNCNDVRTNAAHILTDWLASDPTGVGTPNVLIFGDLNSYAMEDPISAIEDAEYTNLIEQYASEGAYSYVFDGQWGYLDHALGSPELVDNVTGVAEWHINADEPSSLDYNTDYKSAGQVGSLYASDEFRSSDHDPVLVGLDVCDAIAPTLDLAVSLDTLWPANHKLSFVTVTPTVTDNFDPSPTVTLLSVTSSEPDDGLGDGDTANDIQIMDDIHIMLRAERSGTGDGRVYTLTYQATDACGNTTISSIEVSVPKSQGKGKAK